MNLAADRATLYSVLESVAPGRVLKFQPPSPFRVATPAVWIDTHTGALDAGAYMTAWTVIAAADGASDAQLGWLDDVCSAMWTHCSARTSPVALTGHDSIPVAISDDVTVRGVAFTVAVFTAASTFCPTVPQSAEITKEAVNA